MPWCGKIRVGPSRPVGAQRSDAGSAFRTRCSRAGLVAVWWPHPRLLEETTRVEHQALLRGSAPGTGAGLRGAGLAIAVDQIEHLRQCKRFGEIDDGWVLAADGFGLRTGREQDDGKVSQARAST